MTSPASSSLPEPLRLVSDLPTVSNSSIPSSPLSIHYGSTGIHGIKLVSPKHKSFSSSSKIIPSSSPSSSSSTSSVSSAVSPTNTLSDNVSSSSSTLPIDTDTVYHDPEKRLVDEYGYRFRSSCIPLIFPEDAPSFYSVKDISSSSTSLSWKEGSLPYYERIQVVLGGSSTRPGTWILPGGGIEPQETPTEAVKREAIEETGMIGPVYPIGWLHNYKKKTRTLMYIQHVTRLLPSDAQNEGYEDGKNRQRILVPLMEVENYLFLSYHQLLLFRITLLLLITKNNVPLIHRLMNKDYVSYPTILTDDELQQKYFTLSSLPPWYGSNRDECLRSIQTYVDLTNQNDTEISTASLASSSSSPSTIQQWYTNSATGSLLTLPHYILCDELTDKEAARTVCTYCTSMTNVSDDKSSSGSSSSVTRE